MIQIQNLINHGLNHRNKSRRWRLWRNTIGMGLILAAVSLAQHERHQPINMAQQIEAWTVGIKSYVPPKGYIPDEQTALKVSDAILVSVYGEKEIASERPLGVALIQPDVWLVWGNQRGSAEVGVRCPPLRFLALKH